MILPITRRFHLVPSLAGAFFTWLAAPLATAADYYIDPAGNDSAAGTSAATPWQSISKVNATTFLPGDNIYFKKGGTWTGSLWPKGSGNSTSQITLATYGSGAKPLIAGAGGGTAISLSGQSYWTIDGFEVTNLAGGAGGNRCGIRVGGGGDGSTINRIRILNNDVHDIQATPDVNDGARNWGGIFVWIDEPGKANDVLIQGNTVTEIQGQGISFWGEWENGPDATMNYANCSPNVVVRGNRVWRTSGDGILTLGTLNELVEYNEVAYVGALSGPGNNIAAAWPTRHVDGIWQYNHVHHTVWLDANDSTAFDNDGFVQGTTYFQYNYTHDNQGGFHMEYRWEADTGKTVSRYNISVNDGRGTDARIYFSNRPGSELYNNVFYNPGMTLDVSNGGASYHTFRNNIFVGAGRTASFATQGVYSNNTFNGGVTRPTSANSNFTRDPLFVSPNTTGNLAGFLLQSTSSERGTGVGITSNGGKDFWSATVPASTTAPHRGASQINAIGDYTATPSYFTATGPFTATIPTTGSTTLAFTAELRDQNFHLISPPAIAWSLSPAASGYSIDANGVVTISSTAQPQRIAVVATSGSLTSSSSFGAGKVDVVLGTATYTDAQSYGNGTVNGSGNYTVATFGPGANYSFTGNLTIPVEWNGVVLNSSAALNVGGNLAVDLAGISLNGGTLTAGGIRLQDGPDWVGTFNDGKQSIPRGDSIINGSTIVANQSNPNFISLAPSATYSPYMANNLWLGDDGATIHSAGFDIGITMNLQNFSAQTGSLIKSGDGTLTLTGSNGYSGGTTINAGTLKANRNTLGTGAVVINNGGTLYVNDQWVLCGANPYNVAERNIGTLTINAGGTLQLDATNGFANGATNLYLNGGLVTGGPDNFRGDLFLYNGNEQITAGGATSSTIASIIGVTGTNNTITVDDGSALNITGGIKNSDWYSNGTTPGGFIKAGNGTLTLSGPNSYSGLIDIQAGTLLATGSTALGTGGWSGTTMTWIRAGATLSLQGGVSLDEHMHLIGAGVGGYGALRSLSGDNALTLKYGGNSSGPGFAIDGDATIGVDAGTLTVTGFYHDSGSYGITKVGMGTLVLTQASTYTGATVVSAGTLRLGNGSSPTNLANAANVIVAAGAMLDLDFTGTDQIGGLWVDGLQLPPGVYSATTGFITGTGTLTVSIGPASADYATWSGRGIHDLAGGPADDDDDDSVANLLEYVLGGNPLAASTGILPAATTTAGNLVFTFRRIQATTADTTQIFQHGTNLSGWTDVPIVAGGIVAIQPNTPQAGTDTVTITVPEGSEPRIFGRIKVTTP